MYTRYLSYLSTFFSMTVLYLTRQFWHILLLVENPRMLSRVQIPSSKLVELEHSGHLTMVDDADDYNTVFIFIA